MFVATANSMNIRRRCWIRHGNHPLSGYTEDVKIAMSAISCPSR